MFVVKRSGAKELVSFDKILERINGLSVDLSDVDTGFVTKKVIENLNNGITTAALDELAASICASFESTHLNYGILAARILASNNQKNTPNTFSEMVEELYFKGIINETLYAIVNRYAPIINAEIVNDRDSNYSYIGFKTLEQMYLLRDQNGTVRERPQYLWMRVALSVFKRDIVKDPIPVSTAKPVVTHDVRFEHDYDDSFGEHRKRVSTVTYNNCVTAAADQSQVVMEEQFENAFNLYHLMSKGFCTLATPALFNSGTRNECFISCYLNAVKTDSDSIEGMYDTVKDIAAEFKSAGGVGIHVSSVRARGTLIKSTNGPSDGIIPYVKVINEVSRHVKQGGRRNGSIAIYLELWHADIVQFLQLKKPQGEENMRARDLFYALWIDDLFMRAVKNDDYWYLMSENECPGLSDVYGKEFDDLYMKYVKEGRYGQKIKAMKIWDMINEMRTETGLPYLLSKDSCNKKSNHRNVGTIKSSNLCAEIVEFSSPQETACCVLASVSLSKMVVYDADGNPHFDFDKLGKTTGHLVVALNNVIDINTYPTKETTASNMKHRPLGIGVQGLADAFIKMRYPFESASARLLNKKIFECMYFHALTTSSRLSKEYGPCSSFMESPAALGQLQFDLWGKDINTVSEMNYNWKQLKEDIMKHGLRNSLLLALMPTASTSLILGNTECFEPITSNIYKKTIKAGEFTVINSYLVRDLMDLGIWNEQMKNNIIASSGSVQKIQEIPEDLKQLYKTAWEIKQKSVLDMAIDRGIFVCQSQSMNLYFGNVDPTDATSKKDAVKRFNSASFYAWEGGLKTLCYYTRTQPAVNAIQFTVPVETIQKMKKCNDDVCLSCTA